MLWQGQEFGENYFLPENGFGRVMFQAIALRLFLR